MWKAEKVISALCYSKNNRENIFFSEHLMGKTRSIWNSGLRGRLQVWHTFRSLWNCSQGTRTADASCISPLPCPNSAVSTRKEQMHSSGALISVTSTQGQLQTVWFWWMAELRPTVLWHCIYLHTLKS